jgi:putative transposase
MAQANSSRLSLVRYLVRPPLALDRLTESTGGQPLYQFRRPWRDGSTALLLDPLELLERLAALVPPPRRPLVAYHGLLAPRARWRSAIVPLPAAVDARVTSPVSVSTQIWLSFLCRSMPTYSMAGPLLVAPMSACVLSGALYATTSNWGVSRFIPSTFLPEAETAR